MAKIRLKETPLDEWTIDHREQRFRQRPELRLGSQREAEAFIDEVGVCLFQPNRGVLLPSLWQAVAGVSGPAPRWGEQDHYYIRAWSWKDDIFSRGEIFYGKAFGSYRVFIARRLLPYFYAISDMNFGGEEDDYLELYQDGKLSLEARDIYAAILEHGPSSTTALRQRCGLTGGGLPSRRFERALTELQRGLMVSVVGVAADNAWKYSFRYNAVIRQFPGEVEQSRSITSREAISFVLRHYLGLVGTITAPEVARLFGWNSDRLLRIARPLAEREETSIEFDEATLRLSIVGSLPRAG
jgi:hypothetical protein